MSERDVQTPYGPMHGCPDCDIVVLRGTHLCEHGVTTTPTVEVSFSMTLDADERLLAFLGLDPAHRAATDQEDR